MICNNYRGLLVAIDGPNGSGKSTLIECLKHELQIANLTVWVTREPTDTDIGIFTRKIAETLSGNSLACLVAADRYQHLENEVIPNLIDNDIVIMDRYVLSSLILQRMDNVDAGFILDINNKVICPDIQFAIKASEDTIQLRLHERELLTRFEQGNRTNEELKYLDEGINIFTSKGIQVISIDNNCDLRANVSYMFEKIIKARGSKS